MQEFIDIIYERVMLNFAGMILMWSGTIATIPAGWQLCNGTNGTPDLRDKFVVGAKEDRDGVAKSYVTGVYQQTGGNVNHFHTLADISSFKIEKGGDYERNTDSKQHIPPFYALAYIMKV